MCSTQGVLNYTAFSSENTFIIKSDHINGGDFFSLGLYNMAISCINGLAVLMGWLYYKMY